MIRYTLRGLRGQWAAWLGTLVVLGLACALVYACLTHRYAVTRPDVVAEARRLGVGPGQLELSGLSVYVYSALVAVPVVSVVGRSCVQALRTTWAQWRLAGALPGQVRHTVIVTVCLVGACACVPGLALGVSIAGPFASVLTRMAAERMGAIPIDHNPLVALAAVASTVLVAALGALGPAVAASRVPAVVALRESGSHGVRLTRARLLSVVAWAGVCAIQVWVVATVRPIDTGQAIPAGGGQAMVLALLLGVLVIVAAPGLVPPVLRAWTSPIAGLGTVSPVARRSASWRSELGANAVALLALGLTFTGAMISAAQTVALAAHTARLPVIINQVDTYVLAGVIALLATCGGIAIIAMTSRSREREFATLRCAGATPRQLITQALIEPALYVGTAVILSVPPIALSALGEAWFLARAGLPFTPTPAILPALGLAGIAYAVLAAALFLPAHRALNLPINTALAAD